MEWLTNEEITNGTVKILEGYVSRNRKIQF